MDIRGSGIAASETRVVPAFSGVTLAGAAEVFVDVGGEQRVVVHADDNLLPIITTEVEGGVLVVSQTDPIDTATTPRVEVTTPSLDTLRLTGAGDLTLDGHDLERLDVSLSGAGVLRGSGSVERLDLMLSGAGNIELEGLVAAETSAMLSGAGNIVVHATRSLDARVTGVGTIFYGGDPADVRRSVLGPGAVVAR
jgi:Putative auto-transporter adhesin, head GIN domain